MKRENERKTNRKENRNEPAKTREKEIIKRKDKLRVITCVCTFTML